jgi:hypothetical protein
MRSRAASFPGVLSAVALAAALGCSSPQSYVMLLLESSAAPITGVEQVQVIVSKAGQTKPLTYSAHDLVIVPDAGLNATGTLSVGFSGDETGDVQFDVTALAASGCAVGKGAAIVTIKKGATVEGTVLLAPVMTCPADGGAPDGGTGKTFPGCAPARPVCSGNQTCQINCTSMINACTTAGTGAPWASCQTNADCAIGSQCFDYSSLGCNTKICLRFCDNDADCRSTTDGGPGPGSFCRDPVSCGGVATAYHTCSASCDPTRAAATAGLNGCPTGLACLLPGGMDQVACGCPEPTRIKTEGTACGSQRECAPGLICEQTCRAICRCNLSNGACTAANDCPTAGTTCTPLPDEMLFGVCL